MGAKGVWLCKITFPEIDSMLKTDEDFPNRTDEDHHMGLIGMKSTVVKQ